MYRPPYGPGYYPAHNYTRPPNYQHGFNNNTIIVNNGGNNYWNRYDKNQANLRDRKAASPISAARPNRPELNDLNRQAQERSRQATRPAARDTGIGQSRESGRGASGYAGARPENQAARAKMVAKSPPAGVARDLPTRPKTEYKGATNRPTGASRATDASRPSGANRPPGKREQPKPRPSGTADHGYDRSAATRPSAGRQQPAAPREQPASRPSVERPATQSRPQAAQHRTDRTAFGSGGDGQSGRSEKHASQRGRSSMGGGGGGSQKPRKPKH
jgi:hypothetical protein